MGRGGEMNTHKLDRAKFSLLRELDSRMQRRYHVRLSEFIDELRLRHTSVRPDPDADDLISFIDRNRILYYVSIPQIKELRETFDRIRRGTYGFCPECGVQMPTELLEQNPTMKLCVSCIAQKLGGFV
jgi:RNA polymerase-binding transcription factor DksA